MMGIRHNPRSTLHAQKPLGLGTPEVESLSSYFCRLAHSHSMTSKNLAVWILGHFGQPVQGDYKWFRRSFSSMSAESEQWAAWLAELTGVEGLDRLTLAPWRNLLASTGLAQKADRWCPLCLEEDRKAGNSPYLRLSWDVGPVTACTQHKTELVSVCPHCYRTNIRNRASTVVPGYCTACGGFLGNENVKPAAPEALWLSRQVGHMLSSAPQVSAVGLVPLLESVIETMAAGNVASFAKKLALSKSGVWYWIHKGGQPALHAWLAISLHGGITLDKLFAGDITDWVLPVQPIQIPMALLSSSRKGIKARTLNWDDIRSKLRAYLGEPEPITLAKACELVGVDSKHLYQQANLEARAIADRYRRHQAFARKNREKRFHDKVSELLQERRLAGYVGMSAREVLPRLDAELMSVRNVYRHIGDAVAAND